MTSKYLRPGMRVRIKSESEILATLDPGGALDGLPFMPEMRRFCDSSLDVVADLNRIHISGTGVRGICDTVMLEGARCDGDAHGGCGRACYLLFKKDWLSIPGQEDSSPSIASSAQAPAVWDYDLPPCQGQASALLSATYPLPVWDIRQYSRDMASGMWRPGDIMGMLLFHGNKHWSSYERIWDVGMREHSAGNLMKMGLVVLKSNVKWCARKLVGSSIAIPDAKPKPPAQNPLALQPGDRVRVKSRDEILAALDSKEKNRGLRFYGCMLKYCGGEYTVRQRVESLVDEITDKEIKGITNTVLLEDVTCDGISYRGCPRECYWLWREAWLARVE